MTLHHLVSQDEWVRARQELLEKEKEFTRARDQLARARRALPWVRVEKDYVFEGANGKETLEALFAGRHQLIVQHFMFDPSWNAGCPSCSFWADGFDGFFVHLEQRDIAFVAVSRAPYEKLAAYRARMGWSFNWVSSAGTDFNQDYQVSETSEEREKGESYYNYRRGEAFGGERPGISVFYRDDDGSVMHTYSCYARGLDMMNAAYHYIDLTPNGRNEDGLPYSQAWVRRHDEYSR
ncbi:MAG: thioredoxin family protein [Burkholderiaceae bacterium]